MNTEDTKNTRPLILITNDDGVDAPGLMSLVDSASEFGDIVIVAPATAQSGMSSAISVNKPLRIIPHADRHGAKVFSVTGTPVDCVKLALHIMNDKRPTLLLSGVNHGSNSGNAIIYSGTMGAVLEGCMNGISSVGFSLLHHSLTADFTLSAQFVKDIIATVIANPLPTGICLNVNIPALVTPLGVRVCRAATGHWTEEYVQYTDPFGAPFFWLTGKFINDEPLATDTDEYWLDKKYISVVPARADQTANDLIKQYAPLYDKK